VENLLAQLKEVHASLEPYGIVAYESTGSKEEKIAEMAEKLHLSIQHPEPAPEIKKLFQNLLQRCFLWVVTIQSK
jgi:hypothetical protein